MTLRREPSPPRFSAGEKVPKADEGAFPSEGARPQPNGFVRNLRVPTRKQRLVVQRHSAGLLALARNATVSQGWSMRDSLQAVCAGFGSSCLVAYKPPSSAFGTFSPRKKAREEKALDETEWREARFMCEECGRGPAFLTRCVELPA